MKEEMCVILDFLPTGYPGRRHAEPVAQALGKNFSLLELVPRDGINLKPEEEVYVGEGKRDKIRYIKGIMDHHNMTNFALNLLPEIVEKIVKEEERRFVDFFNRSTIVTPRMHQLELLPGVGKKHVIDIMDERRKRSFENFNDIAMRVKLTHPEKAVIKRIVMELTGDEKYHIFTPMKRKEFVYS